MLLSRPSGVTVQEAAAPVGSLEVTTLPAPSRTTHRPALGQETAVRALPGSTSVTFQVPAPPLGFLEVITFPTSSTATHSPFVGHDTAEIALPANRVAHAAE